MQAILFLSRRQDRLIPIKSLLQPQTGVRRIRQYRDSLAADTDADVVTETLYAIFESAVLRLTITDDAVQTEVLDRIDFVLKGLRK